MADESEKRSPQELVGEWVNVRSRAVDDSSAVLVRLDVDPSQDFTDDETLPEYCIEYTMSLGEGEHPFDLLWHGSGEYSVLPRTCWSEKVRLHDR